MRLRRRGEAEPRHRAHNVPVLQAELFASAGSLPDGFSYAADFLTIAQEAELLERISGLPFQEAQYKEWRARRRVVSFGGSYDFSRHALSPAPPIPQFLHALRAQAAAWADLAPARLQHAMIAEYRPATPLGWHRDVPNFEDVIGVSLLGHARMRFRPWPPKPNQRTSCAIELEPRSVYLMRGAARWHWQHAVSPTRQLRYSITFRTRRI
jgi:alkylated DNA repair dioxygenase AlkB